MIPPRSTSPAPPDAVTVRTPARLHLGFLDLNGSAGRRFGSIGLAVSSHHTAIRVSAASQAQVTGSAQEPELTQRLQRLTSRFYDTLGSEIDASARRVSVELLSHIPSHAGLGSGTQLALAMGTALAHFHHLDAGTRDIALQLERGRRSGIGIATFSGGGFVVDGGLGQGQTVPPVLLQRAFPSRWRIVMIMDAQHKGIHGSSEKQAFRDLPLFPIEHAHAICHLTLMKLLPALVEQDLDCFGDAVSEIQARIGDHFAPAQGGRYTSQAVAACLDHARQLGHRGVAQSSWGPTGCVFVDGESAAVTLIDQLRHHVRRTLPDHDRLTFLHTTADQQGVVIETGSRL